MMKKEASVTLLITLSSLIKVKKRSDANHTMRGLCYTQGILERLGFPLALTQTLQFLVYLSKYLICLQMSKLASKKQPKNSLQLPKPTRNTRKIANKFMTVASRKINLQSERFPLSRSKSESCKFSAFHC